MPLFGPNRGDVDALVAGYDALVDLLERRVEALEAERQAGQVAQADLQRQRRTQAGQRDAEARRADRHEREAAGLRRDLDDLHARHTRMQRRYDALVQRDGATLRSSSRRDETGPTRAGAEAPMTATTAATTAISQPLAPSAAASPGIRNLRDFYRAQAALARAHRTSLSLEQRRRAALEAKALLGELPAKLSRLFD